MGGYPMNSASKSKFQGIVKNGDHLVLLYKTESDITLTVTSYISNCLVNNIRCIYIKGDTDTSLIIKALDQIDLYQPYIDSGQLVFISKEDAYSKHGKFNPDSMIEMLKKFSKEAISDGFDGIGISGEISWVLEYDQGFGLINEYEWKLNDKIFGEFPVSALCRYNMDKFTDEMIINVIQLHPYLVIGNEVHENPFYIPPIAFKENKLAKYQVLTWLENIVNFTNTKSDYARRIEQNEEAFNSLKSELTDEIINTMVNLLELHDIYTTTHSHNVANLSRNLAKTLNLSRELITIVYYTALVHDIGKIRVPSEILNKPTQLNEAEYNVIQKHPEWGAKALNTSKKLSEIARYVLHHHERYDGLGYPKNIKGEDIPLVSRILTICDAYDAMTNDRPYRKAYTKAYAIKEIKSCAGTQFDPDLVEVFIKEIA